MADIKVAGSLIPTGVNTPLDKRSRVATLAEIANLGNPVLGAIFYCEEDHKHYKITRLKSKTIGPAVVENAAVDSYEEFGGNPEEIAGINASLEELRSSLAGKADASAVSALDVRVQTGEKMLGAVTENQSIELGFDNVPKTTTADQTDESGNVIYEEDGTTAKTETQRAFRCLVFGDENTYGDSISIFGNGNSNELGFVHIWGNSNKTYQSQTVFGDNNEFTASVRATVFGFGNKDGGKNAGGSYVFGDMNSIGGRNTWTAGYRIVNGAKGAAAFGRQFTLEDSPENEYAFAIGDGEVSLAHRVFRAIENPLYDPEKDADNTGTDSAGERKTMALRSYSTEYRGHWLAVTQTIAETGTAVLDHDQYARWVLTGTGAVALQLDNWLDGDVGTVVVDTTKQTITIPDAWQTLGADITSSPGVYVLEIHQVGETVYYGILCPNQSGSDATADSLQMQITQNYNNYLNLQNTVEQNRQGLQTQITILNTKVDNLPQLSVVQSSSEPANPSNGTIWIQTE